MLRKTVKTVKKDKDRQFLIKLFLKTLLNELLSKLHITPLSLNIPQINALRQLLLRIRGFKCEACNMGYPSNYLDMHHIIPSKGETFSNLIILCKRCHAKMPKLPEENLNSKKEIISYIKNWKRR